LGIMEEDRGFEVCDESHVAEQEMFYSPTCEVGFCSTCWDQQIAHRPNRRGQALHVRTNYYVARKIRSVLSLSADEWFKNRFTAPTRACLGSVSIEITYSCLSNILTSASNATTLIPV
jgi:hypothetical protein